MVKINDVAAWEALRECIVALKQRHTRSAVAGRALDELMAFVLSPDSDFNPGAHLSLGHLRATARKEYIDAAIKEGHADDEVQRRLSAEAFARVRREERDEHDRQGYPVFVLAGGAIDPTFTLRLQLMTEDKLRALLDGLVGLEWTSCAGNPMERPTTRGEMVERGLVLRVPEDARGVTEKLPLSPEEWSAIQNEVARRQGPQYRRYGHMVPLGPGMLFGGGPWG